MTTETSRKAADPIANWKPTAWGQEMVDNLNRNVMASIRKRAPPRPWLVVAWSGRTFAVSPGRTDVREYCGKGCWSYVDTKRVIGWLKSARSPVVLR